MMETQEIQQLNLMRICQVQDWTTAQNKSNAPVCQNCLYRRSWLFTRNLVWIVIMHRRLKLPTQYQKGVAKLFCLLTTVWTKCAWWFCPISPPSKIKTECVLKSELSHLNNVAFCRQCWFQHSRPSGHTLQEQLVFAFALPHSPCNMLPCGPHVKLKLKWRVLNKVNLVNLVNFISVRFQLSLLSSSFKHGKLFWDRKDFCAM